MEGEQVASSRDGVHDKVGEVTYFCLKQHKPSSNLIYQHNSRCQISDGFVVQNTCRGFVLEPNPESSAEGVAANLGNLRAGGQLAVWCTTSTTSARTCLLAAAPQDPAGLPGRFDPGLVLVRAAQGRGRSPERLRVPVLKPV